MKRAPRRLSRHPTLSYQSVSCAQHHASGVARTDCLQDQERVRGNPTPRFHGSWDRVVKPALLCTAEAGDNRRRVSVPGTVQVLALAGGMRGRVERTPWLVEVVTVAGDLPSPRALVHFDPQVAKRGVDVPSFILERGHFGDSASECPPAG